MKFLLIVSLCTLTLAAHAQGEIYECNDAAPSAKKNASMVPKCKRVSVSDAPGSITGNAAVNPATNVSANSGKIVLSKFDTPSTRDKRPNDFPKVDDATQKSRDSDRRQILLDETQAESLKLADLRQEFNDGKPLRQKDESNAVYQQRVLALRDNVSRSEKNVEALKRELASVK